LPINVRQKYLEKYYKLRNTFKDVSIDRAWNESNANDYKSSILTQVNQTINLLERQVENKKFEDLVKHCQRWDQELGLNALELYPELAEEFKKYGY